MRIRLYANLRHAAGTRVVQVPSRDRMPIYEAVRELIRQKPQLKALMLDKEGNLAAHIAVVVNGRDVRHLDGVETMVSHEDQVDIFPPVGGGGPGQRTVSVRFAGDLHARAGGGSHGVTFRGRSLQDLIAVLVREFDIGDLIREGGTIKASVQVTIDGRLAYTVGGWDTAVEDGATICIFSFGGALPPVDLPEGTTMREIADKAPGARA